VEPINLLVSWALYVLLFLSAVTIAFFVVVLLARVFWKKDLTAPKTVAAWAGIATSVGSFAIALLNANLPIGVLPDSDPAAAAIRTFYAAIQSEQCKKAWTLIHAARKEELRKTSFGERQFCDAYETTLTYRNMTLIRQDNKKDGTTRIYHVAYDVEDLFPRNDLYDLGTKSFSDVARAATLNEKSLMGTILSNLRLYYVVPGEAEPKIRDLVATTPFWFTASPEFIAETRRLLKTKHNIALADQKSTPPHRRVPRHYVHSMTLMLDGKDWKIRDGLAAPVLVAPYLPRDKLL
jgi:hypothetical protein